MHLKGLPLTSLAIPNDAKTDLGLKHYLAALETHAAVHDGRVGRGRGVLDCQHLLTLGQQPVDGFPETSPIDRLGLVHLKGLTNLQELSLYYTKVTDAGVADLQKSLPDCKISK